MLAIAALAAWLGNAALQAQDGLATCYALAFALVVLAFVEHGFLVVPWQDTSLFRWALRDAQAPGSPVTSRFKLVDNLRTTQKRKYACSP